MTRFSHHDKCICCMRAFATGLASPWKENQHKHKNDDPAVWGNDGGETGWSLPASAFVELYWGLTRGSLESAGREGLSLSVQKLYGGVNSRGRGMSQTMTNENWKHVCYPLNSGRLTKHCDVFYVDVIHSVCRDHVWIRVHYSGIHLVWQKIPVIKPADWSKIKAVKWWRTLQTSSGYAS